ncbi:MULTISPECIES: M56 family metallopeptidase [unclassified Massilia]|uniref:M56 family metallopeptidase n=1 Tax=unclassified Massilia TaxID=2609279 RepID=UPI00177DA266|nr:MULTISPECIES: M56 family metallopeptidase [unclassified Massilia]MBD8530127.1 M56 family metallopeptidase [Massilia sp. CFBP 13647]MBD8674044.1 M56 family metallopeptidase [Massilia sp. CFBP 13721]
MTGPELIGHIGATLLDSVWQAALVGLEASVAMIGLRKARPQTRYLSLCLALLLCLLWPAVQLIARLHGAAEGASGTPVLVQMLPGIAGTDAGGWQAFLQAHLAWIVAGWAVVAGALGLRLALGMVWIGRAGRSNRTDAHWDARLSNMAVQFGIARKVRLRVVDALASPVTAGWWRPVVLVPASLVAGMPPQLLEALLAHELAHVRRHDYLVNLAQSVIETILFYHPVVWWLSHRIRVERELIADDIAARQLGEPRRLALALSELERLQFSTHHLAQAANGGDLMTRIKRLVRPDTPASNWKAALPVLAMAAACLAGCAGTATRAGGDALEHGALASKPIAQFNSCAKPEYTPDALARRAQGTTSLRFLVDTDGSVAEAQVSKSSGDASLDEAARAAIAKCRFTPGMANGKPARAWAPVQYVWSLG